MLPTQKGLQVIQFHFDESIAYLARTVETVKPYLDKVHAAVGPQRPAFGGDWPARTLEPRFLAG